MGGGEGGGLEKMLSSSSKPLSQGWSNGLKQKPHVHTNFRDWDANMNEEIGWVILGHGEDCGKVDCISL